MKINNFITEEFVPKEVFDLVGDNAINLMDKRLLNFIDKLRDKLGRSITINNWKWGGDFNQRGLRTKDSKHFVPLTKYNKLTNNHPQGKALDFDVTGMPAHIVRQWIIDNRDLDWVDAIGFIEDGVNWVHVDVRPTKNNALAVWNVHTEESVVHERN